MSLKVPFAAVFRMLRAKKGLSQESFPESGSRQYLSTIELGKSSVTIDKLNDLSATLGISPATILVATLAVQEGVEINVILERVSGELRELLGDEGLQGAIAHIADGELVTRHPGAASLDDSTVRSIGEHKARGCSQTETAASLGLNKVTVHRYWKRV